MSINDLRVKSIQRRNIVGYAELTIEADCLEPSPDLDAMKERIEAANKTETLLRKMVDIYDDVQKFIGLTGFIGGYPLGIGIVEEARALLVRIDAASEPRQPR